MYMDDREYERHREQVSTQEKESYERRDEEKRVKTEEEEEKRRERMEKASQLNLLKEELTAREDFLVKQAKQSKAKQKIQVRRR